MTRRDLRIPACLAAIAFLAALTPRELAALKRPVTPVKADVHEVCMTASNFSSTR